MAIIQKGQCVVLKTDSCSMVATWKDFMMAHLSLTAAWCTVFKSLYSLRKQ